MIQSFFTRSAALIPQTAVGQLGWLRGAIGGALAIGLAGLVTYLILGPNGDDLPWLVAPMGASAVLVFAVPASPLAQPWSVIGGNMISGIVGIAIGMATGSPMIAAGVAVGLAICAMSLARCLHPPGGACALLCALGAAGQDAWGWVHLLPVLANVLTLCMVGWFFNNLTGHRWPHRVELPATAPAGTDIDHTREDIAAVLADWDEVLDVDVDDLDAFYQALGRHVARRQALAGRGSDPVRQSPETLAK